MKKNKIILFLSLFIFAAIIFATLKWKEDQLQANAHLDYLEVKIKDVRSESVVVSLTKAISEKSDSLPKMGDTLYLFIPKSALQKTVLPTLSIGDELTISVNDASNIYSNGGLYTIVITDSEQLNK